MEACNSGSGRKPALGATARNQKARRGESRRSGELDTQQNIQEDSENGKVLWLWDYHPLQEKISPCH